MTDYLDRLVDATNGQRVGSRPVKSSAGTGERVGRTPTGTRRSMRVERNERALLCDLGENGLEISYFLNDAADIDLDDAMAAWGSGDTEISLRFKLREILDSAIDVCEVDARGGVIDIYSKPLFDQMRRELVEMIERIDALKFGYPDGRVEK